MLLRRALEVERWRDFRAANPWFERLNAPRQAALVEVAEVLSGVDHIPWQVVAAVRDEHYAHAEGLLHRFYPRLLAAAARQIATGEWQKRATPGPAELADPVTND